MENVWGIGRRLARFLCKCGIETALDLSGADDRWVRKHMSVTVLRTVRELRGIPSIPQELSPPPKKQICVSRSFGKPVRTLAGMQEAVASYASRAAEKVRRERLAAGVLMVFMMTNRFRNEPQYAESTVVTLPVPTDCTQELIRYALLGGKRVFREGYRFIKAGVILAELCPADQIQTDLFDTINRGKSKRITETLDRINARMGAGTMKYAAEGLVQPWKTKFRRRSPRYTTRWDELPVVAAL